MAQLYLGRCAIRITKKEHKKKTKRKRKRNTQLAECYKWGRRNYEDGEEE